MEEKRLFLGFDIRCNWDQEPEDDKKISSDHRHLTFAFLGMQNVEKLFEDLKTFPPLPFSISPSGFFYACIALPKHHPSVVAYEMHLNTYNEQLLEVYESTWKWIRSKEIPSQSKHFKFFPHISVSRNPNQVDSWIKSFHPRPFMLSSFHLYESLGHSRYNKLWGYPLLLAWEEIEHVADLGYRIRGATFEDLYRHAELALAEYDPNILNFLNETFHIKNLEDVIYFLNRLLTNMDIKVGCPFKAVSHHGKLMQKNDLFEWDMIVDV